MIPYEMLIDRINEAKYLLFRHRRLCYRCLKDERQTKIDLYFRRSDTKLRFYCKLCAELIGHKILNAQEKFLVELLT